LSYRQYANKNERKNEKKFEKNKTVE